MAIFVPTTRSKWSAILVLVSRSRLASTAAAKIPRTPPPSMDSTVKRRPSAVSIVEAVSMFGQPLEQIRLLSLGTTVAAAYRPRRLDRGGLIHWVRSPNVAQVLLAAQSQGAFTASEHLLGRGRAFRLNPPAPESLARLDAADARDLLASAAHHSRDFCPTFAAEFASHRRAPYTPMRTRKEVTA